MLIMEQAPPEYLQTGLFVLAAVPWNPAMTAEYTFHIMLRFNT